MIEVDRLSFIPYFGAASLVHRTRRLRFDVEDLGRAATGEPRLAATTLRLAEVGSQTAQSNGSRPSLLGLAAAPVGGDWKSVLMIVKADTVVAWHRKGFRLFWRWKIHRGKPGRPSVPQEVRKLIQMMSRNTPRWGAPRIH